jgi:membrane-associated phospholipid phosphatase
LTTKKQVMRPWMARIFQNRLKLFFILLFIESLFFVTNGLNSILRTPTDGVELKIGFIDNNLLPIEMWLIPYTFGIFLPALLPLWASFHMPNKLFRQYVISMALAASFSYVVYIVFPTYVVKPSPEEVTGDGMFSTLLRAMYEMDNAYSTHNAAPSQHVFYALITMSFLIRFRPTPQIFWRWTTIATLIMASALLTRRHHSPDLITGYAVAVGAYVAGLRLGAWVTHQLGDEHYPFEAPRLGDRQRDINAPIH